MGGSGTGTVATASGGTLFSTIIDRIRVRIRDPYALVYTDANITAIANGILHMIRQAMVEVEANLVYAKTTITTADGTLEYTPSVDHQGFLRDGVWLDGYTTFLKQLNEEDQVSFDVDDTTGTPEYYFQTEDGKVGFLPVPDDAYTVNILYWPPLTELVDGDSTVPWGGIWDQVLERMVTYDLLEAQGRSGAQNILMGDTLWRGAMNRVMSYGCRRRRINSGMFDVAGC